MLVRLACFALIAAGLPFLAGCGPAKLNESRSWDMEPAAAKSILLPKQSKPQKVKIEFSSSDSDVTVLVFKGEDAPEDTFEVTPSGKALESKTGKGETFTIDVPANQDTRIVVRDVKVQTKVQLKVTN